MILKKGDVIMLRRGLHGKHKTALFCEIKTEVESFANGELLYTAHAKNLYPQDVSLFESGLTRSAAFKEMWHMAQVYRYFGVLLLLLP